MSIAGRSSPKKLDRKSNVLSHGVKRRDRAMIGSGCTDPSFSKFYATRDWGQSEVACSKLLMDAWILGSQGNSFEVFGIRSVEKDNE